MPEHAQPEQNTNPTDHDDPAFPWAGVVSYGIAFLLFGGLAVVLVLDDNVATRIGGLLSAALAGFLFKIPFEYVVDWRDAGVVDEDDDGLDVLDDGDPGGQP